MPPSNDRALLRRIAALFKPYKREVTQVILAVIVGVLLGLLPPYFFMIIIDEGLLKQRLDVVGSMSLWTLLAVLAGAAVTLLYGYLSVVMGQKIMCDLRYDLFAHLQKMSLRFFTQSRTGDIQTRLLSDVAGVQNVVSNTLTDQLSNIAIVLSTVVAMFLLDWRLTVLSIAMIPLVAIIGRWVGEFARKVRKGTQEQTSELNSLMQENLSVSGILLTKTAGNRELLLNRFSQENKLLAHWQIKSSVLNYMFFGMVRLITQFAPTLIYWLAGWLMIRQGDSSITVGLLVAFTGLQARLFFPITGLLGAQVEIMSSFALFDRIFEYVDMKPDVVERGGAKALTPSQIRGSLSFEDVCFKYESSQEHLTLDHINFQVEPGQIVALVGPSGAGKTTLTYLLPRLYDPDSGCLKLDGIDVRDIQLDSLQQAIGAVTQETYLLHTTLRQNLTMVRPDATEEQLIDACRAAAIYDHIQTLPEGFETVVGERGYKFSGGEKQRIAIARAILKDPRILILDEATSALDTHSERLIQESLSHLMKGRTTFAIAHRLSTILAADLILVMNRGKIVERGRHEELLALGGLYKRLYDQQFAAPELA